MKNGHMDKRLVIVQRSLVTDIVTLITRTVILQVVFFCIIKQLVT